MPRGRAGVGEYAHVGSRQLYRSDCAAAIGWGYRSPVGPRPDLLAEVDARLGQP